MQVTYTSDLHIDSTAANRTAIERIADAFVRAEPDAVIVAGDAGNTLAAVDEALSLFAPLKCPKFFVSGNHDVWIERIDGRLLDSRTKCLELVPAICERHGFHDLDLGPQVVDGVGFAGSLGWYDYSLADPRMEMTDDEYWGGRWGDIVWWDKDMTFWPSTNSSKRSRLRDGEVCEKLAMRLDAHLTELDAEVDRIVTVIHTLPFVESLPREDPPYLRDAFTGAARLGDVLRAHPKVVRCVGAHKHLDGDWTIDGVTYHRRPLGRIQSNEAIEDAVKRSIGFFEI